jgi:hypothetical protein
MTIGMTALDAAQGSSPAPPHTGQATTTIALPVITVTDPNGSTRTIALGSLVAHAVNESDPFASLGLPGWQIDTSSGAQSGSHDIPLTTGPASGDIGIVDYDVHADTTSATSSYGALTAMASTSPIGVRADLGQHGVAASVTPDASTGSLDLTVTGLQVGLGDLLPADVISALPLTGLVHIVSALGLPLPAGASSVNSSLSSLANDLTAARHAADQLATARTTLASLLAALPGTALAQQHLTDAQTTLSNDLAALQVAQQLLATDTGTMQQLQTQAAALTAAVTTAQSQVNSASASVASSTAQINSLTAQINSLLGNPLNAVQIAALTVQLNNAQSQLSTAQSQLTAAQAALTAAQAALAPVQAQLAQATATVATDQQLVTNAQQHVSTDQAAVTAAQQALDALVSSISNNQAVTDAQTAVSHLTATLSAAVSTVSADIAALPDLTALRGQLLSALTAAPLVDVGTLGATLSSTADDNGGTSTISCTISGASVLGQSIPNGPCSDLVGRFAAITTAISGALDQLPVAAPATPVIGGLVQSTGQTTPTAADRVTDGTASVTPLHLSLPATSLGALADAAVTSLASVLTGTQQSFSALGIPAVTSALSGSLGTLAGTVGALPTGSGLAGLHTLGVDVRMVGLSTAAAHNREPAAGTTPPGTPTPTAPTPAAPTPAAPGRPAPSGPTPAGPGSVGGPGHTPDPAPAPTSPRVTTAQHDPLPFTGDNSAVDLALALIVMLAGAHFARRGRRQN